MAVLYYLPSACYSLMHYSAARPGKVRARGQHRFQAKSGRRTSGSQIQCAGLIADYLSGQTLLYLVTSTRVQNEAVPPPSASRRTGSLSANQGLSIPAALDGHITATTNQPWPQSLENPLWRCLKMWCHAEVCSAGSRSQQRNESDQEVVFLTVKNVEACEGPG